jgi:hypothetical protein
MLPSSRQPRACRIARVRSYERDHHHAGRIRDHRSAPRSIGVIPAGAVVIVDGTIRETGPFAAIASKYPGISVVGDGTQLLMPGLVDAHSHGRGLFADPERCAQRLSGKRSLRLGVGMNPCSTSRSIGSIAEHRPGPRVRIPFAPAASQQRTVPGVGRRWSQKDESDADVL